MKMWRTPFDLKAKAIRTPRVLIDKGRCKGCGYCVEFCPREALSARDELSPKGYSVVEVADESKCLGCGLCEVLCPDFAIHVLISKNKD